MAALLTRSFLSNALGQLVDPKALPLITDAFAYGSAVVSQGVAKRGSMVDLLLAVEDTKAFHSFQLGSDKRHHYAPWIVSGRFASCLNDLAAKVYFNTGVSVGGCRFKYGVIGSSHFLDDLVDWKYLYAAGRLHKPVVIIKQRHEREFWLNRKMALKVASLVDARQWLRTLIALSYDGDMRMAVAEDPRKIENILEAQKDHLLGIYSPLFSELADTELPRALRGCDDVRQRCQDIVRRSSWGQLLKGGATTKPSASLGYLVHKIGKRFRA